MCWVTVNALLVHLTLEDEVRGRAGERGRASNAGRVTHTQTHPFGQAFVLGIQQFPPHLLLCVLFNWSIFVKVTERVKL